MSVTQPCPAGSVMLRDSRAWHGGTPNLSRSASPPPWLRSATPDLLRPRSFTRAIPGVGFRLMQENEERDHSLPYETWKNMTPMGQHICRYMACDEGEVIPPNGWQPHWHNSGTKVGQNATHVGAKVDNPFAAAKM